MTYRRQMREEICLQLQLLKQERLQHPHGFPTPIWILIVDYEIDSPDFVTFLLSTLFTNLHFGGVRITSSVSNTDHLQIAVQHPKRGDCKLVNKAALSELLMFEPQPKIIPKAVIGSIRSRIYDKIPSDLASLLRSLPRRIQNWVYRTLC